MATNVRDLAERVETLLQRIEPRADADELVRTLVTLYGEGLARMLEVVRGSEDGEQIVEGLCADEFVASLLIVHDLHPVPLEVRIQRALDSVRPYLRSHGGEVEIVDIDDGIVELRLRGTCDGCPSSSVTLKHAVEKAIYSYAPEIIEVRSNAAEDLTLPSVSTWTQLDGLADLAPYSIARGSIDQVALILVRGNDQLYAYRDRCPTCAREMNEPTLQWPLLRCASCGESFDTVLAGKSTSTTAHLEPLPLSDDGHGVRVAVPAGA